MSLHTIAGSEICVVGDGSRTTERHYTGARNEGTCTKHAKSLSLAMTTSPLSVTEPVPVENSFAPDLHIECF